MILRPEFLFIFILVSATSIKMLLLVSVFFFSLHQMDTPMFHWSISSASSQHVTPEFIVSPSKIPKLHFYLPVNHSFAVAARDRQWCWKRRGRSVRLSRRSRSPARSNKGMFYIQGYMLQMLVSVVGAVDWIRWGVVGSVKPPSPCLIPSSLLCCRELAAIGWDLLER